MEQARNTVAVHGRGHVRVYIHFQSIFIKCLFSFFVFVADIAKLTLSDIYLKREDVDRG